MNLHAQLRSGRESKRRGVKQYEKKKQDLIISKLSVLKVLAITADFLVHVPKRYG